MRQKADIFAHVYVRSSGILITAARAASFSTRVKLRSLNIRLLRVPVTSRLQASHVSGSALSSTAGL